MRGPLQTLLILVMLAGCEAEPNGGRCARDTDCPPGQRCADAICTPVVKSDTGPVADLGPTPDHRPGEAAPPPDRSRSDALQCTGNHDDKIDRPEMPIAVGGKIHYSVGTGLTVDLKGKLVAGKTQWDLTAAASDDHPVVSELLAVPAWATASYPGATYSALLDESYGSYGVFKATPSALQLIGVVSTDADKIKLGYSKPIDMLRFPITAGDSFTTDATVSGTMNLLPIYNLETYNVQVVAAGDLALPQLTLPTVLVRIKVEQMPYGNPWLATTRHLFMFISECYGIVAQIVADGDPKDKLEAVKTKERRRLSM